MNNIVETKDNVGMKDGEEPTEVLLALVSSPLLALQRRGLARILTAKGENGHPVVLAVFGDSDWNTNVGIVAANTANKEKP